MTKLFQKIFLIAIFAQSLVYATEIKVYFSPSDKVDNFILENLKKAKKSVYITSYSFNWKQGYDTLKAIAEKGVDVKILVNFLQPNYHNHKNLSIKKWDKKAVALHSKFIIIDEKYVFVGSANFTESSLVWDSNNILFIDDPEIAKFFSDNFFSLWKKSCLSNNVSLKKEMIEIYLSPAVDCTSVIINEIKKATNSIKFAIFSFTSDAIGEEICKKGMRGIKIYGIFEGSQNPVSNEYYYLKRIHFFKIKKDCFVENIHDKLMIVDDNVAVTGSFNYSLSASRNIETLIIVKQKDLVGLFVKKFKHLWLWY